jgi:hypothetical protein
MSSSALDASPDISASDRMLGSYSRFCALAGEKTTLAHTSTAREAQVIGQARMENGKHKGFLKNARVDNIAIAAPK